MPESHSFQTTTTQAHADPAVRPQYQPNMMGTIGYFVIIMVIFYLFMIKPQQAKIKKRRELLSQLKKGDQVQTSGGIRGQVQDIKDDYVVLRIAKDVKVEVSKEAVHLLGEPHAS